MAIHRHHDRRLHAHTQRQTGVILRRSGSTLLRRNAAILRHRSSALTRHRRNAVILRHLNSALTLRRAPRIRRLHTLRRLLAAVLPGRPEEDTLQVVAVVETEAVLDRTAVRPQLHSQIRLQHESPRIPAGFLYL